MFTPNAAVELAELVRLGTPAAECLHRLAETAAAVGPACRGATATLWAHGQPELTAATHPDLGWLIEHQGWYGEGPVLTAIDGAAPVVVDDLLTGSCWPRYRAEAVRRGIRSQATLVGSAVGQPLTLTAYALRAQSFSPASLGTLAVLVGHGAAAFENAARFGALQDSEQQLRERAESRPVIDLAKGILMQTLWCDEERAFDELRQRAQRDQLKLVEVARRVLLRFAEADTAAG